MAIDIAAKTQDCLAAISISAQAFIENRTIKGVRQAKSFFAQTEQRQRVAKYHSDKTDRHLQDSIKAVSCPLRLILKGGGHIRHHEAT